MLEIRNILEGYWRLVEKQAGVINQELKDEGERRFAICMNKSICDQLDPSSYKCKLCGCYMPAKTLVMKERCPQLFWREKTITKNMPPGVQPA